MLFHLICENIVDEHNAILKRAYHENMIQYSTSGSSSQYINGSLQLTKPEYAFDQMDKSYDWCSNCGKSKTDFPWIIFHVKNHEMKLSGYYLKAGCCERECCCEDGDYCCECCLFSWSLQISNDNVTWKTVHKIERDYEMRRCKDKTYKFSETYTCRYVRLIQDETCYGDPPCIALNKIELLGTYGDDFSDDISLDNDEEDVSIIGHISKQRI